jgi:DNA-binding PadR family transcriptional regulator
MQHSQTADLILGMLSIEPNRSGYDIRKMVESSVSYFWRESYGQIYPTLKRMAREGLIVARPSASKGKRKRQEYALSSKGRARLREWLAAPYRDDPPRSEFLLKLFFGRAASPNACIQHVRHFQANNKRLLGTLLEIERQVHAHNAGHPHLPFWLLTLSCGIAHTRASIEWSESALTNLSSPQTGTAAHSKKRARRT